MQGEILSRRMYDGNESIVLVGFFGAGKRTLGLIASAALRRELVDFDVLFQQRTGLTATDYIAARGTHQYRELESRITVETTERKRRGCILVGFFRLARTREYRLLKELSKTNPVIHVKRDRAALLASWGGQEAQFNNAYNLSIEVYNKCSNFDFFNTTQPDVLGPKAPLKLKQTERNFVSFLQNILGFSRSILHSNDPFSASYTHCLQVGLGWLEDPKSDLTKLDSGADAVSLVIDADTKNIELLSSRICKQISCLRSLTRAPILFDIENVSPLTQRYWELLDIGLRQAPHMATVALDFPDEMIDSLRAAKGYTTLIGTHEIATSWSNIDTSYLQTLCQKAGTIQCAAIRMSSISLSTVEDFQCARFIHAANESSSIPLIAYNCSGNPSICFNPILSPVVISSQYNAGVTLRQATSAVYSSFLMPPKRFTIVGKSVSYSQSPAMHNAAYEATGMPHLYDFRKLSSLSTIQELIDEEERGGIAVSLPYKMEIMPLLHDMALDARHIGAVNTVLVERNSTGEHPQAFLKGYNTDYIGVRSCIERNLSPANSVTPDSSALIIGAGGMARAAIYACCKAGFRNICIYNRTIHHAYELAAHYNKLSKSAPEVELSLHVLESLENSWPEKLNSPTVVVSCIPADGIPPNEPIDFSIPRQWLHSRTGGVFVEVCFPLGAMQSPELTII